METNNVKINLNFNFKDLGGNELNGEENHAGKLVANLLASSNDGKAIKMYIWASTLYKKEILELDITDKDLLYNFIDSTKQLSNLAKAQIMLSIKKAENKQE